MAMVEIKNAVNGRQQKLYCLYDRFCVFSVKESGLVDDTIIAQIKQREKIQREVLQKQYGKNSLTRITPVDVISSMGLKFNAREHWTDSRRLNRRSHHESLAAYWKFAVSQD